MPLRDGVLDCPLIAFRFRSSISTDLWVGGVVPGATPSGKTAKVQYAIGSAQGPVQFADLEFLKFKVPDQAFSMSTSRPSKTDPA